MAALPHLQAAEKLEEFNHPCQTATMQETIGFSTVFWAKGPIWTPGEALCPDKMMAQLHKN